MNAENVQRRADTLTALYRGPRRAELQGTLRGFFRGAEIALDQITEIRKNPDQVERGKQYLKTLMELLAVSESTLTVFTAYELHDSVIEKRHAGHM